MSGGIDDIASRITKLTLAPGLPREVWSELRRIDSDLRAQRAASRERVREVVREAMAYGWGAGRGLNGMLSSDLDAIAARAAEQLAGQAVQPLSAEERAVVEAARLWRHAVCGRGQDCGDGYTYHSHDCPTNEAMRGLVDAVDRLLSTPGQVASTAAGAVAEPQPGPAASAVDAALCRRLSDWTGSVAHAPGGGDSEGLRPKLREVARQLTAAARLAEAFEEATGKLAASVTARENAEHDLEAARRELAALKEKVGVLQRDLRDAKRNENEVVADMNAIWKERDAARAECERLRSYLSTKQEECAELRSALEKAQAVRWAQLDTIRALLATEPAVSEERCAEIERLCLIAGDNNGVEPEFLAAARQLLALRAGLREIVGGETTSAPTRAALDARQLFDLQRMREDYRVALEEVAKQAERFPRIEKFAEARDERRRHLWLLDHLLSIFGGTQT